MSLTHVRDEALDRLIETADFLSLYASDRDHAVEEMAVCGLRIVSPCIEEFDLAGLPYLPIDQRSAAA